jgi:hypothetical protein
MHRAFLRAPGPVIGTKESERCGWITATVPNHGRGEDLLRADWDEFEQQLVQLLVVDHRTQSGHPGPDQR